MPGQGKGQHRAQHNGVVCPSDSDLGIPCKARHPQTSSTGASHLRNNLYFLFMLFIYSIIYFYSLFLFLLTPRSFPKPSRIPEGGEWGARAMLDQPDSRCPSFAPLPLCRGSLGMWPAHKTF